MFEESVSATIPSSSSIWQSMSSFFTPAVLFVLLNIMIGTIALIHSLANKKHHHKHSQNDPNNHHQTLARSPSILHRLKCINFYTHYRSQQEPLNISKPNPDYSSHFNLDHDQNPQTQQVFQENHHENQAQFVPHEKDPILDGFERTHEQNHQETRAQLVSNEKDSISDGFQQAHDHNLQETQTQLVYDDKDSILDGFDGAREDENVDGFESMDEVYSKLKGGGVGHFGRSKSDTEPSWGKEPPKVLERMRKSASSRSVFGHFQEDEIVVEARRPATVREATGVSDGDVVHEVDAKADDFINRFKQQLKLQKLDSIIRYKDMISGRRGK